MASSTQVKEITSKLEQGVKNLFNSDTYTEYLKTMSRFHRYSTRNTLLIHMQQPGATLVAGFTSWKTKFGRYVKKNEKGIQILAPVPFTKREEKEKLDPDTKKPILDENGLPVVEYTERQIAKFNVVYVYDVTQTDGKALPTLVQDLAGNVEQYAAFMDALKAVSPLPIVFESMPENMDGVCRFGKEIAIRAGMSEIQTVSAIIHEMTHAKLHEREVAEPITEQSDNQIVPPRKDRRTEEVEAESVSYAVCQYFGIETGANSFGYLAEWSKGRELKELNASLDTIRKTSAEMIDAIDGKFREIAKDRDITLSIGEAQAELAEPALVAAKQNAPAPEADNEKKQSQNTTAHKNYQKLNELFPQIVSGEYSYLNLEAGGSFEPLSLEWVGDNRISVMHTYTLNGDLCYDPMIVFEIDKNAGTLTAAEFEQSIPPLYQRVDEDGNGQSIDGNGNERTIKGLQAKINDFASQWFDNIGEQEYMPVKGNLVLGEDNEVRVTFDKDGKPVMPEPEKEYSLGYGFLGNGITVWNHAEKHAGEYVTVAHIERDRAVTFYDKDMPDDVKESIENAARTMDDPALDPLPEKQREPEPVKTSHYLSLPDPAIGVSEMNLYGYTQTDMHPLTMERAFELYNADSTIYILFSDNTEMIVLESDDIHSYGSNHLLGITHADWERSPVRAAQMAAAANAEGSREAEMLYGEGNRFGIYQIRHDIDESRNFNFASMKELQAHGLDVVRGNYELVYTAPFSEQIGQPKDIYPVLNRIYEDFNIGHPADFTGHSVSVSDVIVLKYGNNISSHYVDSTGFEGLAGFLGDEKQAAIFTSPIIEKLTNDTLSQVGNRSKEERPDAPKTRPTLMERLAENKLKAARQGQQPDASKTNKEREVRE